MRWRWKSLFLVLGSLVLSACNPINSNEGGSLRLTVPGGQKDTVQTSTTPMMTSTPQPLDETLVLTGRTLVMETTHGTLHIRLLDAAAPKTTENFIRLTNQGYYDGTVFHRMVESPNMTIIQGGDPEGTGRGGQSIWGKPFEDEIFIPNKSTDFRDASLYPDYNGTIATYPKGYLAMANAGPNTNGSQFFVMLKDTKLPPAYTIFGKIDEADFPILDTILAEVSPDSPTGDGKPDQSLQIIRASLVPISDSDEASQP